MAGLLDLLAVDPLARKELSGLSRRWPTYAGRVACVGIVGLVVYAFWSDSTRDGRLLSPSEHAELGRRLFHMFVGLQIVLVALGSVIAASDMVMREVRGRTLALLFLTPLSGLQIAVGKWKAAMLQAGMLVLCGVPVLAICAYLGGVGPWEIAWSTALTAAIVAVGTAIAVLQAAVRRTAGGTLLGTLLWSGWYLAVPFLVGILFLTGPFCYVHPLPALVALMSPGSLAGGSVNGWIFATPVSFLLAALILRSAGRRLMEHSSRLEEPPAELTEEVGLLAPGAAVRPWVTETAVWDDDPLLWKELATRPAARCEWGLRSPFVLISLTVLALIWPTEAARSPAFLCVAMTFLTALVLATACSLFTRDKEDRRIEMILCTPVSSGSLLRAKLLSGILAPECVYALGLGALVIVGCTIGAGLGGTVLGLIVTGLFVAFAYALGAAVSLHARTARGAFLFAATFLGLLVALLPSDPAAFGLSLGFTGGGSRPLEMHFAALNPLLYLRSAVPSWCPPELTVGIGHSLLFYGSVYTAATLFLLAFVFWRFRRAVRPAEA